MIKPWKIGTTIASYYASFSDFIREYDSNELSVKKLGRNKYLILDENSNAVDEFSETTATQFLRSLCFIGAIRPTTSGFKKVNSLLKLVKYEVLINKDVILGLTKDNSAEMISNKITKDLRSEFLKNDLLDDVPTHKNFIYAMAITLITNNDKIAETQANMMLDGTKVKEFSKYYGNICQIIEENDPNIKHEIRKVLLGEIDNFRTIMEGSFNEPIPMNINISNKTINDIKTEVLTFDKFLNKGLSHSSKIKIPIYQREYRWEWNTLVNLLIDIKNIKEYNIHNIGTIMTIDEKSNEAWNYYRKIIDGQQRITSLSIILRAFYDICISKKWNIPMNVIELFDSEDAQFNSYSNRFIKIKGNKDFNAFQEMINGEHDSHMKEKTKVSKNFVSTLRWLSANIKNNEQAIDFWKKLLHGILFIVIADSNSDEYRLFEKMNTGSINLNTMELFKNHLLNHFSEIVDENEERFQTFFTNNILEKFKKSDTLDSKKIDTFILTILRLYGEDTTQDSLFEQFKNFIDVKYINEDSEHKTIKEFEEVIINISNDIDLFDKVTNSNIFTQNNSEMYPISDFLKILEGRTVYAPLIMKIIKLHGECLNKVRIQDINMLRKYLRVVETFEIRFQVVSYRGQSLSEKMAQVTQNFNKDTTPEELFKLLTDGSGQSLSIQNEEAFERALLNLPLQNKIATIMTLRIENFVKFNGFDYNKDDSFDGFYKKLSREHILPKKYGAHWLDDLRIWMPDDTEQIDSEIERTCNLIGNAIIAPDWKNASWGNLSFSDKWVKYNQNQTIPSLNLFSGFDIKINDETFKLDSIEENTEFTPKLIDERTEKIAALAREIWKDIK